MRCVSRFSVFVVLLLSVSRVGAAEDAREFVRFPEMMQTHMLANMRGHLAAVSEILTLMARDELERAGEVAESRLGMSSLEEHGASHMAGFMPEGMRKAGTAMHHAASRFALRAEEGDGSAAYAALAEVTSACVSCHAGYRIR